MPGHSTGSLTPRRRLSYLISQPFCSLGLFFWNILPTLADLLRKANDAKDTLTFRDWEAAWTELALCQIEEASLFAANMEDVLSWSRHLVWSVAAPLCWCTPEQEGLAPSFLFLCFLDAMKWQHSLPCALIRMCYPTTGPKIRRPSNCDPKPYPLFILGLFITVMENWLIQYLSHRVFVSVDCERRMLKGINLN